MVPLLPKDMARQGKTVTRAPTILRRAAGLPSSCQLTGRLVTFPHCHAACAAAQGLLRFEIWMIGHTTTLAGIAS